MTDCTGIHIDLQMRGSGGDRFEMHLPLGLLYAGFKVSFLAPERLEEVIFKLLKQTFPNVEVNFESSSLEELLLALPSDRVILEDQHFQLRIERS